MLSKFAQEITRRLKNPPAYGAVTLWVGSLLLWLVLFQFPWPARLALAYGSFLLWSLSSGAIWDRKAPFLTVGFFLAGSWLLQIPDQQGAEAFSWLTLGHGLWILVVFFSSLSSMMWVQTRRAAQSSSQQQSELGAALLQVARMASLGHRMRGVCHEFKNQIAVTTGYMEQLLDSKELSVAHQRKIDRSLQASEKMLKILTPLRLLAQDTWDKPLEPAEWNKVIVDAFSFVERHLLFKSIVINLDLGPNLPLVEADTAQLNAIIMNLLYQSIESFKEQNPAINQARRIHITTDVYKGQLRLQYTDNACRIKALTAEQLFDLSYHMTSGNLQQGLDRMVVQQLIQELGGSIAMHEDEQLGMNANVLLPQANAQAKAETHDDLLVSNC